ncbi:hypothetical protein LguiA_031498 [Lonicera macranthoides]
MAKSRSSLQLSALPVTIFAHLLVIAIATLVLVWLLHFREGFAFSSDVKQKIFNLHPLLMVLGFILITGEGILGIYAVFKFHNELFIPNMYTLHSWLGMSTICLFGIQWLLAFFSFFFPGTESSTRARFAPWHIFFGVVIFFMAILSAETGLVEKFIFLQLQRSQEALIVNFTGLLILLFAIAVSLSVILLRRRV